MRSLHPGRIVNEPAKPENEARRRLEVLAEGLEGIAVVALAIVSWPLLRIWRKDAGSRPEERAREWPGDRALPGGASTTRGIAIRAPAESVWPWLVQIGRDKAGFYSYELVENLGGLRIRNVERILPEHQTLAVDDFVSFSPKGDGLWVEAVAEGEHIVLRTWRDNRDFAERDVATLGTWSLHLLPTSTQSCRLLVRTRSMAARERGALRRLVRAHLGAPLDWAMERRMLRTIRRLAESTA